MASTALAHAATLIVAASGCTLAQHCKGIRHVTATKKFNLEKALTDLEELVEELETGDLLFFGRRATEERPERVTHEAIYMGDSEFINSAGYKDRVTIQSMDSTRENYLESYSEIFVRAVRIVGEEQNGFEPVAANSFYREIFNFTP